jgi:flagella basal body P-ring formation protein FlgA
VIRRILLLVIVAGLLCQTAALASVAVKQRALLDSEDIRLGDLFDGMSSGADIVVGKAPLPGESVAFDGARLAALARGAGLEWTPPNRHVRVVVERLGRAVERHEFEAALTTALRERGLQQNYRAEIGGRGVNVFVAPGAAAPIHVRDLRFDREFGRFSAILDIEVDADSAKSVSINGRAYPVVQVAMLARIVRPGEVIRDSDLEITEIAADRVGRDVLIDQSEIVGRTPRRQLSPSAPLRRADLQAPILVAKGSIVDLVVQTPNMMLIAKARAAEDGALGDSIRVVNTRSEKTVMGVVDGLNRVVVPTAASR